MSGLFAIASGSWVAALGIGLLEKKSLSNWQRAIPHRVVVGGVRGKTTLAGMLHTALLAGGIPAACRVSGDAPVYMDIHGKKHPIQRRGNANIREIRRSMRRMAGEGSKVAIVENMAIDYDLQAVLCGAMVSPTLVLVAPDAPDHLEKWPLDPIERARKFLATIPMETPLLFVPTEANQIAADMARDEGRVVHWPAFDSDFCGGLPTWIRTLASTVHHAVDLMGFGGSDESVIQSIVEFSTRASRVNVWCLGKGRVVDLLSANDPVTTRSLVEDFLSRGKSHGITAVHLVYNHRSDRPARLASFLPLFREWPSSLVGDPVPLSCKGIFPGPLGRRSSDVMNHISTSGEVSTLYILVGNNGGEGVGMRETLASEGEKEPW